MGNKQLTELEDIFDLELLTRGDRVKLGKEYMPIREIHENIGAYHTRSHQEQLHFAIRGDGYITRYRAKESKLRVEDNVIIVNEDKSVTETVRKDDHDYQQLNETLIMAGL